MWQTIKEYTRKIAEEMHVRGLMNMQYAIENGKVYVLEANPRASRTVPLVSKVCNIRMVPIGNRYYYIRINRPPITGSGIERAEDSILRCQGSGFPIQYVPGSRPCSRTGNAFHRRSPWFIRVLRRSLLTRLRKQHPSKLPLEGTVLISVNNAKIKQKSWTLLSASMKMDSRSLQPERPAS